VGVISNFFTTAQAAGQLLAPKPGDIGVTIQSRAPNLPATPRVDTAAVATHQVESAFDDSSKAVFGAAAVFLYWLIVTFIWLAEAPVFDRHQLTGQGLTTFTIGALAVIVWFSLLAMRDKLGVLLEMFRRVTRSNADECHSTPTPRTHCPPSSGVAANPWIPVTLTFLLAGWLIYVSGGITNSPYGQIPVAIVLIGQNVYKLPPIDYNPTGRLFGLPSFLRGVVRVYWYPIVLVALILVALTGLQAYAPVVRRAAPLGEILLTTFLTLLVCMCVTFVTRHSDRKIP
jgi:hypothetical protein